MIALHRDDPQILGPLPVLEPANGWRATTR